MLMTGRIKDKVILEMFGDNKKTLLHLKKELYWEELIGEADSILEGLLVYDDVIYFPPFMQWVQEERSKHIPWAFHEMWAKIGKVKEGQKQLEVENAAKRVVYRYISSNAITFL